MVFLPPLLYSAAFFANLHELKRDARAISMAAIGLVLATMVVVAVVAHELIAGLLVGGGVHARRDRRADRPGGGDRDRAPSERAAAGHLGHRGREPDQRRHGARRLQGRRGGRPRRDVLAVGGGHGVRARRRGRDPARAGRRLAHRGGPGPVGRHPGRDHDLAAERLRGLPARRAAGLLGRAGGRDGGHRRRLAGAADLQREHAPAGLRGLGDARLPAQRAAVRAHRPAASAHPRRPRGTVGGDAHRAGGGDQRHGDPHADRLVADDARSSSARSTAARSSARGARTGACG